MAFTRRPGSIPPPSTRDRQLVDARFKSLIEIVETYPVTSEIPYRLDWHDVQLICDLKLPGEHYYLFRTRPEPKPVLKLSPREQMIARLVAQGLPNKAIGAALDISRWTVATYLRRMFSKLGVGSRTALVSRLIAEDLL